MTNQTSYDVIIIGAGVIGANLGFELSKAGYRTLNVDKAPAAGYGSTSSSSAIVRCHYSTWAGVAMAYEGFHFWKDWENYLETVDERGTAEFVQCGGVLLGDRDRYFQKVLPLFDRIGIEYEVWDTKELRRRIPGIDLGEYTPPKRPEDDAFWEDAVGEITHAVFTPVVGYVSDPQLAAHNLQRAAEAKGGTFRFRAEVTGVRRTGGRVTGVELADGTSIDAPVVVNVAGPHSSAVNQMAGVEGSSRIKTRALRKESYVVAAPSTIGGKTDRFIIGDDDLGIYSRPETGSHLLFGSQDPECDPKVWVDRPDDLDRRIDNSQWQTQVLRLSRRFPTLGVPHDGRGVVDMYDVSDDWIPIYDRTDLDGFYVAIGTSGNQFKNCHIASYCMTRLIQAVESGHDHEADPLRVTMPHTGIELDMGAFSRNRQINDASSFSVLG